MVMFGVAMPSRVHSLRRDVTKGLASLIMMMGVMHPSETQLRARTWMDGGGDPAAHEMRGGHALLGAQPDEGHQGVNQPHHLQIPTKQEDDLRNFILLSQILV